MSDRERKRRKDRGGRSSDRDRSRDDRSRDEGSTGTRRRRMRQTGDTVKPATLSAMRRQLALIKEGASKNIREKEEDLVRLRRENAELQDMLAQQIGRNSMSMSDRQYRVKELNTRLVTVQSELEGIEQQRSRLRLQLEGAVDEKKTLETKLQDVSELSRQMERELVESTNEAEALEGRLRSLESEVSNPLAAPAESDASRRLLSDLDQVRAEKERLRAQLADAKVGVDSKRSQLEVLLQKLHAASALLTRRDGELREIQLRTDAKLDYTARYPSDDPAVRSREAALLSGAKDEQIAILSAKAQDCDGIMEELLDFVRSAMPGGAGASGAAVSAAGGAGDDFGRPTGRTTVGGSYR